MADEMKRLSQRSRASLEHFASLLLAQVGRALGRNEAARLWERHILDSLSALPLLRGERRMADVGSGAGLPGIPLALAEPSLAVTLVEPRAGRALWLRETVDALSAVNVEVVQSKWERAPARHYDVAVARALAPPEECLRLLRSGPHARRYILYVATADAPRFGRLTVVDSSRALVDIDTAMEDG